MKYTSDTLSGSLGIKPRGTHSQITAEDQPELTIREMTASEINALEAGAVGVADEAKHGSVDHAITES